MNALAHRNLGRIGLRVSCIALGTVELGLDYGISGSGDHQKPDEAAAARLLNAALDLGITLIDTARMYGEAESIIGRAIAGKRDAFVIASKVSTPADLRGQALREYVLREVDTSLANLRTDHVDVMYSHSATVEEIERGEVYAALDEARRAGKLRAIGASTYGEAAPLAALAHGGFDCIQIAYNLLDRTPESRVFPLAQSANVGVVVRSVLLKGVLTHRYAHLPDALAELRSCAERLQAMAASAGASSLPEMAYRYVLANPVVSSALVGTARESELVEVTGFAAKPPLPTDALRRVAGVSVSNPDLLNPGKWPPI